MKHSLKITAALVALQMLAAQASAGHCAAVAPPPLAAEWAAGAADGLGEPSSQRRRQRGRRRRGDDALTPGVWGGEHIRFVVAEGGAAVEYDCARGTVEGRIVVDREGRFSVAGLHYEERGGPIRADDSAAGHPVRLTGRVGGSLMKLTVTRADTKEVVGTYTLTRDGEAELVKCR